MGKIIRIYQNFITGELAESRLDEEYEPTNLGFDSNTRVVVYKFTEMVKVYPKDFVDQNPMNIKVGYMSPYINENGKYCRFIDGKISEI